MPATAAEQAAGLTRRRPAHPPAFAMCDRVCRSRCLSPRRPVFPGQTPRRGRPAPPYLALLGGSYCSTQFTSGMSIPRAITSVHTRIPLGREEPPSGGRTPVPTQRAPPSPAVTAATGAGGSFFPRAPPGLQESPRNSGGGGGNPEGLRFCARRLKGLRGPGPCGR